MKSTTLSFNELTTQQLFAALHLRALVFVVEQNCAYQDPDAQDLHAHHVFMWNENTLVAYARILPPGSHFVETAIGRVVVHPEYRNLGLGKRIFAQALADAHRLYPNTGICIHAQSYLRKFYEEFAFATQGEEFLEDGIPHVRMAL